VAEINQFGSVKPVRSGEGTSCAECEAMLMDALDHEKLGGVLTAKQQAAFDRHIATCAECSQMLADARRGAALLEMLKSPRPEPSAALIDRILAQTSGAHTGGILTGGLAASPKSAASGMIPLPAIDGGAIEIHSVVPASAAPSNVIPFRPRPAARFNLAAITRTMMQPRLAMTAAMAFFSITLTLNLTGVHITDLKASDLTPANLKHTFYHANASVVRYYDNLRVVYELESRVNELKQNGDDETRPAAAKPAAKDGTEKDQSKPRKAPKSGSGTSQRRGIDDRRGIDESRGMDDRPSPPDQHFKLASLTSDRQSPPFVIPEGNLLLHSHTARVPHPSRTSRWVGSNRCNTALARSQNKFKEALQEGDQV